MTVSTHGNQRSSYIHYEDAFKKTLLLYKSDMVESTNIHHQNAKYNISLNNTIKCDSNQILTCALHSADIPISTYQINRFNDTLYLYLPDWAEQTFDGHDRGVVPVRLPRRNYTSSQLVATLQQTLDDLVDSTFATEFSVSVGTRAFQSSIESGYVTVPVSEFATLVSGADADTLDGLFSGYKTSASGGLPNSTSGTFTYPSYVYNDANLTYTVNGKSTQTNIGRTLSATDTYNEVHLKSQPRFTVTKEDNDRIQIRRADLLGSIPVKGGFTDGPQWKLSAGPRNHLHLGLNKATFDGDRPTAADFTQDIYNETGLFDDSRERGSVMRANYQSAEFAAPSTTITTTHSNRIFFPGVMNLNCHSTILIKSAKLKANVFNSGKHSNIIAKIPVNVQSGYVVNYEPQTPIRYNLGNSAQVQFIDIELTDSDGQILDFNGQPHDIAFLFEVWNVVSIPLDRHDDHYTKHDSFAPTLREQILPQRFETETPSSFEANGGAQSRFSTNRF